MDGQTVLTKASYYASSAVTNGGSNKDLKDLMVMMKQLKASITAKAEIFPSLSTKTNSGGG